MKIEDYRSHIDRIIREMTGEVVLNGSPEHATVIVERMLAHAKSDVSILTRRFDPRIYGTTETIKQASLFLGEPARTVKILIEEVEERSLADHPFVRANHEAVSRGNLKFRKLKAEWSDGVSFNFSVMDDRGYRFERDKKEPVASAAFGETSFATRLRGIFNELWTASADIPLLVHA